MGILTKLGNFQHHNRLFKISVRFAHQHKHLDHGSGVNKIRNVGIMAHIDAGKTTITERMLFYSGYLQAMGEVHKGDTVMDHMDQERERGITITSAAITFPWQDHNINLIDTPGHVDFTIEVERALRVLDGGVVLLDGSAGVEAQTMTVWRQASRNKVPCIAFINKLDKANADLDMTLASMKSKLDRQVLLTQLPMTPDLKGVIDLVHMEQLIFDPSDKGCNMTKSVVDSNHGQFEEAFKARAALVEQLSELDDSIAESVLSSESFNDVSSNLILTGLKKAVLESKGLVTLCGSAYKNIGVQPLMTAINSYLPSPNEINHEFLAKLNPKKDFCAMAFKIVHHPTKGVLTYIRIYSGTLREGDAVYNMNRNCGEKANRLAFAYANTYVNVNVASLGSIVVVSGLRETITGDTLVSSSSYAKAHPELQQAGVEVPDPVFFCTIEPPSMSKQKQLELALNNLAREDPSLRVIISDEAANDQTVLSGMGELHLEIILQRIRKEYKVDADLGQLMVTYKEAPKSPVQGFEMEFERTIAGSNHKVSLELSLRPLEEKTPSLLKLSHRREDSESLENLRPWQLKALTKGFKNAVSNGPLLGYPVLGAAFELNKVTIGRGTSDTIVSSAMVQAVKLVLQKANTALMEPMMKLVIHAEPDVVNALVQDLVMRRGEILEREELLINKSMIIMTAQAPLSELRGYSTHLRSITSGKAFFGMEFSHYDLMDLSNQNKAILEVTGFQP